MANLKALDQLVEWVARRKGGRTVVGQAMDAGREIFLTALLPDRKLVALAAQPLAALPAGRAGDRRLLLWTLEDALKQRCGRCAHAPCAVLSQSRGPSRPAAPPHGRSCAASHLHQAAVLAPAAKCPCRAGLSTKHAAQHRKPGLMALLKARRVHRCTRKGAVQRSRVCLKEHRQHASGTPGTAE